MLLLRSVDLNTPKALSNARFTVPILFGFWSLWLGQDTNFDLLNYHLYTAFAFLQGKLHIDFAAAGGHSYFNPLLDLPYYLLTTHLPAQLVSFLMGAVHGLNFILLLGIAQKALPNLPGEDRYRVPLLLAVAGCLTANFLSGLGSSMGDATTSLFVLGSLLFVLTYWEVLGAWSFKSVALITAAGLIAGLGAGLKLTNAGYAIALSLGLLAFPAGMLVRIRLVLFFGLGTLLGVAITGGYWYVEMWRTFDNPLFPMFSNIFPNPLSGDTWSKDDSFLPLTAMQAAFWPFIFSLDSHRVGQATIHQIIWPIVYLLFWFWMSVIFINRLRGKRSAGMDLRAMYVLLFVTVGYLLWMKLFSIYRYIVPIELAAPLISFIILSRLFRYVTARRIAAGMLGLATLFVVLGGVQTFGHTSYANPAFHAELPKIDAPERSTVIIVSTAPLGWLVTLFPPDMAFVQFEGIANTSAYNDRMRELIDSRGGTAFALVDTFYDARAENVNKANSLASMLGMSTNMHGCKALRWATETLHTRSTIKDLPGEDDGIRCQFVEHADDLKQAVEMNLEIIEKARQHLEKRGYIMDRSSCSSYKAGISQRQLDYQWCRVLPPR